MALKFFNFFFHNQDVGYKHIYMIICLLNILNHQYYFFRKVDMNHP